MKQFEISQAGVAMKVNTDALCLAAWARLRESGRMLDVGSGTGVIALVLAQRYQNARITGIEPHPASFRRMAENFRNSPWAARLTASPQALAAFAASQQPGCFDAVLSNPPYFSNGLRPADDGLKQAKHMQTLNINALAENACRLLASGGTLSLIYPPDQMDRMTSACVALGMFPVHECTVFSRDGEDPVRTMKTFTRSDRAKINKETLVIYQPDGTYTEMYRAMLREFLIIF